ncbi:TonB-dependent receptor [Marinilabilia sp.]|uniref:TonB-dependent receptor n=1 Tax=Marinilabilia sp. TaxID=2021252 RepID=UPI0025BBF612|nr:TonB-dependent receptor [Marinilabilia sp.]
MINGQVTDEEDLPIEFVNVGVFELPDTLMVTGTITGSDGRFSIPAEPGTRYLLKVSCLGYLPESRELTFEKEKPDVGTISLSPQSYALKEVRAEQTRIRASGRNGTTTYFVNQNIQKSSATGIDVMKFVPGIQVDMMQKISIEGEENILVLVDGVERTTDYLGQIDSELIDKLEIDRQPGTEYRSDVGAVVNIITTKNTRKGISGHLYGEIPVSQKEVYAYPSAGLHYNHDNLNIFGSYKGEFSYFDIEGNNTKTIFEDGTASILSTRQMLEQKNWSHKAMAGVDWLIDDWNRLNFYGFINPYSNEQDGQIKSRKETKNDASIIKNYEKDDTDENLAIGSTLYFKHLFSQEGHGLFVETGYYQSKAHWMTLYHQKKGGEERENRSKPEEKAYLGRIRYQTPIKENYEGEVGVEGRFRDINDAISRKAGYREEIWSAFGSISRNLNRWEMKAGVRTEYSLIVSGESDMKEDLSIFPFVTLRYEVKEGSHLNLSYRRSVKRPYIFHLNPAESTPDMFTKQKGNPALKPEFTDLAEIEYSMVSGSNFLAFGLFYRRNSDVIGLLTKVNNNGSFSKEFQNMGQLQQGGFQIKAALSPSKKVSFSPYFKGIWQNPKPKHLLTEYSISSEKNWTSEWGGALAVQAGHGFSLSASAMQRADVHQIQAIAFEDMLYFISIEKSLFENLKAGITCAVPFNDGVTYQGHEIRSNGFSEYSEDNILTSRVPLWFKIKYSFSSGRASEAIEYSDEFGDKRIKKGF